MKSIPLITLLAFLQLSGISQSLEGKWKGIYSTEYRPIGYANPTEKYEIPISLEFILQSDGSYQVYSKTIFNQSRSTGRDTVTCLMISEIKGDSVVLQEVKTVSANKKNPGGFQRMKLKLTKYKKQSRLSGKWEDLSNGDTGDIYFTKLK